MSDSCELISLSSSDVVTAGGIILLVRGSLIRISGGGGKSVLKVVVRSCLNED